MSAYKVLTLHQPWATLIALGVKSIETRSWRAPKSLVDERIAIHAGAKQPASWVTVGEYRIRGFGRNGLALTGPGLAEFRSTPRLEGYLLPLGAIVATARLTDCLPMLADGGDEEGPRCVELRPVGQSLARIPLRWGSRDITGQVPYGDFRPGRWAWLLEDVQPLAEPEPFKGGQGLTKSWEPTRSAT